VAEMCCAGPLARVVLLSLCGRGVILMTLVNIPVLATDRRRTTKRTISPKRERKKNHRSSNIRCGAGDANDGELWSHCALLSDSKGAGSIDRAILWIE